MFFVRKKKYDEMKQSRGRWKMLAGRWMSHAESANKLADEWQKIAVSCQEDNKRLIVHEEEMLAKMKELDKCNDMLVAYVKELEKQRDMWRERAEEENKQAETYRGMLKCAEVG